MAIQKKEIEYSKELDDVALALVHIVSEIKAKKSVSEIAGGSLSKLIDAVAGADLIGGEIDENRKVAFQTLGYRVGELTEALVG